MPKALAVAKLLAEEGIECEVVDLRGLVPLDESVILQSLGRTRRLLAVEEEPARGGWANLVVSGVAQRGWSSLRRALRVVPAAAAPVRYRPPLEAAHVPSARGVADAASRSAGRSPSGSHSSPSKPPR